MKLKARIINMPKDTKRRDDITAKLREHPYIDYSFIEAVDGRLLSPLQQDQLFDRDRFRRTYRREVKPGEIGCVLSHRNIWKESVGSRQPMLAIEDDALFLRDFEKELLWAENYLDSDSPRIVYMSDLFLYRRKKPVTGHDFFIASPSATEVTTCYAINPAAAEILLKEKPYYPADAWDIYSRSVEIIAILPVVASQEELQVYGSSINSPSDRKNRFSLMQRACFKIRHILTTAMLSLKIYKKPR